MSRIDRGTDAKVDRARTRASAGVSRRTSSQIRRLIAGDPRRSIVSLALLIALGATGVAIAKPGGLVTGDTPAVAGSPGLAQHGAVANNGFPSWYRDRAGTRLEPCLDADDPLCVMGALPDPNSPVTPDQVDGPGANFPDEFFYQSAGSGIDNVGNLDPADPKVRIGKATGVSLARAAAQIACGRTI